MLVSGLGDAGVQFALLDALVKQGAHYLTIVSNSPSVGRSGVAAAA